MKKLYLPFIYIFFFIFLACEADSYYDLEVETSLSPEKESYECTDTINISYSFIPDFDNFTDYVFRIIIRCENSADSNIIVYDDETGDKKSEYLFDSSAKTVNSKITKTFRLEPTGSGKYDVNVWGYGDAKKHNSTRHYVYDKHYILNVE